MARQSGGSGGIGRPSGTDTDLPKSVATDAAPYTTTGGGRRRRNSRRRRRSSKKGGCIGVISNAAVPFGLLALQRYFKGSKTSKRGLRNMGKSFKRTFRRRR